MGRTVVKNLCALILLVMVSPLYAEDSSDAFEAATKKIRAEMPVNIVLDSVKIDGPGLVIEGRAVSNPDVAAFLRFLDEKIGRPDLQRVQRVDDSSVFMVIVKKLKEPQPETH